MSALEDIMERLCAVQRQIVPTSLAFPTVFVTTGNTLYWTNAIDVVPGGNSGLGATAKQIAATVTMRLHRAKFTENLTDPMLGGRCLSDISATMKYFAGNRDLQSTEYPDAYPLLSQQSAICQRGQIGVIASPDGTQHFGTIYTLTFAYYEIG